MNNDENPGTPAVNDQFNQQATPQPSVVTGGIVDTPSPQPSYVPAPPAQEVVVQPASDVWQTKQEYAQSRPVGDPALPYQNSGKFVRVCAYILGASVFLLLVANLTPVGDLFATFDTDNRSGRDITARPLVALAMVTAIISYICLMSGLIAKRAKAGASKAGLVTLFVLSMIALFNPISAIILLMAFFCNLSPCQSS